MADKFIRHGETYCGDGTSSAAATSDGGPGAWNDINVFEGSAPAYGSLNAGDVVYIRSKDNTGADITRTATATVTLGSATATIATPIRWILDDGTVWSGVDGTLTYQSSSSSYYFDTKAYNHIIAKTQDHLVFLDTHTNRSSQFMYMREGVILAAAKIDNTAKTGTNSLVTFYLRNGAQLITPTVKAGRLGSSGGLFRAISNAKATIVAPDVELTSSVAEGQVFGKPSYGDVNYELIVHGGRCYGTGATTGASVCYPGYSSAPGIFKLYGFVAPSTMSVTKGTPDYCTQLYAFGLDGAHGSYIAENWGQASSFKTNNPPYLNATLPDSGSTGWAWWVYPEFVSGVDNVNLIVEKTFTDTAAAKTVTLEFLASDTFSGLNAENTWIDVTYIDDATGATKIVSSRDYDSGALTSSTVSWSSTTWGLISFDKYKLAVTTPSSIKKDTPIIVAFHSSVPPASANDIYFIDPSVQLT